MASLFYILHTLKSQISPGSAKKENRDSIKIEIKNPNQEEFVFNISIDSLLNCRFEDSFFKIDSAEFFLENYFSLIENRDNILVNLETDKSVPINSLSGVFEALNQLGISFRLTLKDE